MSELTSIIECFLDARLPGRQIQKTQIGDAGTMQFMLPTPPGASVRYGVAIYYPFEAAIIARPHGLADDHFFWHLPFESHSEPDDSGLATALIGELDKLIHCPSRIRQRRGWLLWSFTCEVKGKTRWHRLGGIITCCGARVPNSSSPESLYESPPILEACGDEPK